MWVDYFGVDRSLNARKSTKTGCAPWNLVFRMFHFNTKHMLPFFFSFLKIKVSIFVWSVSCWDCSFQKCVRQSVMLCLYSAHELKNGPMWAQFIAIRQLSANIVTQRD